MSLVDGGTDNINCNASLYKPPKEAHTKGHNENAQG